MVRILRLAVLLAFVLALIPSAASAKDIDVSFTVVRESPTSVTIRATILGATGPLNVTARIDPYHDNPTPGVNALQINRVEKVAAYRDIPEYETVLIPIDDKIAALAAEVEALALQKPKGDDAIAEKKEALNGKEDELEAIRAKKDYGATYYETQEVVRHKYELTTKEKLAPVVTAQPGDAIMLSPQSWAELPPQQLIADKELDLKETEVNWGEDVRVYEYTIETGENKTEDGWGSSGMLVLTINGRDYYDDTHSSWWSTNWPYKMKLTIDNSASTEDLTDFPIMVKLTPARFDYSHAQLDGDDIRFVDADDSTSLNYELDTWDRGGDSIFWVQVPQIDAASTTDFIWMYYGSPTVGNGENAEVVWENGYVAVYHMNDKPGDSTKISDSTANANEGTKGAGAAAPTEVAGGIGKAQQFAGAQYANLGSDPSLENFSAFSISAIMSVPAFDGASRCALDGGYWNAGKGMYLLARHTSNNIQIGFTTTTGGVGGNYIPFTPDVLLLAGSTWDGVNVNAFKNGAVVGAPQALGGTLPCTLADWFMGAERPASPTTWFDGTLDELRLSSVARSGEWIEAEYLSMWDLMITYEVPEDMEPLPIPVPTPVIPVTHSLLLIGIAGAAVWRKHIIIYTAAFILFLFWGLALVDVSFTHGIPVVIFAGYMLYAATMTLWRR